MKRSISFLALSALLSLNVAMAHDIAKADALRAVQDKALDMFKCDKSLSAMYSNIHGFTVESREEKGLVKVLYKNGTTAEEKSYELDIEHEDPEVVTPDATLPAIWGVKELRIARNAALGSFLDSLGAENYNRVTKISILRNTTGRTARSRIDYIGKNEQGEDVAMVKSSLCHLHTPPNEIDCH